MSKSESDTKQAAAVDDDEPDEWYGCRSQRRSQRANFAVAGTNESSVLDVRVSCLKPGDFDLQS